MTKVHMKELEKRRKLGLDSLPVTCTGTNGKKHKQEFIETEIDSTSVWCDGCNNVVTFINPLFNKESK